MLAGLAAVEDPQRTVAHLPAVTEGTVEDGPSPALGDAGNAGRSVIHPGREEHAARAHRISVAGRELEAAPPARPSTIDPARKLTAGYRSSEARERS